MLLQFPNSNTLMLAMSSGTIPESAVSSPLAYARDGDGAFWIDSEAALPSGASAKLKKWGVSIHRSRSKFGGELQNASCWLQMLPLQKKRDVEQIADRTQVLFVLRDESKLPGLVNEILRLGNDRLSFRRVEWNGEDRILLRVIGAPYYSLLRASEAWAAESSLQVYVERGSRIWIAFGYQHPLESRLVPAAGQHLLIDANSSWFFLQEQPFQDVYSVLEFKLPEQPQPLVERGQVQKLSVPLRLSRSTGQDAAEIMVLTKNAIEQLDRFVQAANDAVLERLAFAVAEPSNGGEPTVIIRVRPGRTAAPVMIFDGLGCRNYLKIPNLFVPIGKRIHPPLRRDAVRSLLAADEARLVWLAPVDDAVSREDVTIPVAFETCSIPDAAFLPLSNWVDYILDRDQQLLTAWRNSHQFEFEEFICRSESTESRKKRAPADPGEKPDKKSSKRTADDSQQSTGESKQTLMERLIAKFRQNSSQPAEDAETIRLRERLSAVESQFLGMETHLEDPQRSPLWREMADINAALARYTDSSICRQHEFWDATTPDHVSLELWFRTDAQGAFHLSGKAFGNAEGVVTDRDLRRLFQAPVLAPAEIAQFASWLVWAVETEHGRTLIRSELPSVLQFLERYESGLAVRACWLAWSALARMTSDVLMLARARDRVLDRMYQHGLIADRDVPSFLRLGSGQSGEQIRQVREEVRKLHETVRAWSSLNLGIASSQTLDYIDLTFAFAFARLGESTVASELVHSAQKELLGKRDPVHRWLFDAYQHRIDTILAGQPATAPFPEKFMKRLEGMDRLDRYKVDRLRQHSCILEPVEQLDPYREWRRRDEGSLEKELADLFVENDRKKLGDKINVLLKRKASINEQAQVLTTALELSARLGQEYASGLLSQVTAMDRKLSDPILRAELLEKGLLISAHFDEAGAVQECFNAMSGLLKSLKKADVATLGALEKLLSRSFVPLRKLGMRNEIAFLLEAMSKIVRSALKSKESETERLRILLQLAGGWFYFGQDHGWKDIDTARELLLGGSLVDEGHVGTKKQTDVAISYIQAVGQAPLKDAVDRLQDLFQHLTGIRDGQTVSSHYSLKHLDIVEALVQTIVSDSFTMDKNSLRWMDEEEFLIRRRIHQDLRKMMSE